MTRRKASHDRGLNWLQRGRSARAPDDIRQAPLPSTPEYCFNEAGARALRMTSISCRMTAAISGFNEAGARALRMTLPNQRSTGSSLELQRGRSARAPDDGQADANYDVEIVLQRGRSARAPDDTFVDPSTVAITFELQRGRSARAPDDRPDHVRRHVRRARASTRPERARSE